MEQKKSSLHFLKHLAGALGATAILFTGFMGFAHTKAGRPALVWLGSWSGKNNACPLGFDRVASAGERSLERSALARAHVGRPVTSEMSVFGFELGRSSKTEVEDWVGRNAGSCEAAKSGFELACTGPFFASDKTSLWLEFDERNHLVGIRGSESYSDPRNAIAAFARLRGQLASGGASADSQATEPELRTELQTGLLAQVAATGEYGNLSSSVRVTNMGDHYTITHRALTF